MHEISFDSEGRAEAAFAGTPAWHGLGTLVPHHLTPREALERAGLDWRVEQLPILYRRGDGPFETVESHVVNLRSDDGRQLGIVGRDYVPVQNAEQAEFIEALVGEGEAAVECVGALRDGRRQFWTVRLPGDLMVCEGDRVRPYLIVTNAHDGTLSLRAFTSAVRVVCSNTLTVALEGAGGGLSIRHQGDVRSRIQQARRLLSVADEHHRRFGETLKELASVEIEPAEAEAFTAHVLPFPRQASERQRRRIEATRELVLLNLEQGAGSELAGRTPWGLYQATSEWLSHQRPFRGRDERQRAERRFESLLLGGPAHQLEQRAFREACRLLDAA